MKLLARRNVRWGTAFLASVLLVLIVDALQWGATAIIPLTGSGSFVRNGEYPSALVSELRGPRYASWNGSDANRGELVSKPFTAGVAIAIVLDGYPRHPGEELYLERADGARLDLRPVNDPGESWTPTVTRTPLRWIGKTVRLHAVDASTEHRGWFGVADLRSLNLFEFVVTWRRLTALLLLCAVGLALRPAVRRRPHPLLDRPELFFTVASAALILARLDSVSSGDFLNADEAQMTAQAITFAHDPFFWRDIDGTTSGPLNTAVVALPALLGIAPTLQSSRLIGVMLVIGTLVALYAALRKLAGEPGARLAVLLGFAFFSGVTNPDQLAYASELLPMLLSALALAFVVSASGPNQRHRRSLMAAGGAAIGALPLAKLQSAPIAAFIAAYAIARIIGSRRGRRLPRSKLTVPPRYSVLFGLNAGALTALLAGIAAIPALVVGGVALAGGFADAFYANAVFPREYLASNCCAYHGVSFFFFDPPISAFLYWSIGLGLVVGAATLWVDRGAARQTLGATLPELTTFALLLAISIYAIEAPQTAFPHYLLFLIVPVLVLDGIAGGAFIALMARAPRKRFVLRALLVALAIGALAPALAGSLTSPTSFPRDYYAVRPPSDPDVPALRALIKPGQTVAMWGWSPQYLVYTDARLGTRDAISQFQIEGRSFQPYYRARYLGDFGRIRPDFVLEAVGPRQFAYHDRASEGLDNFPALAAEIRRSYTLVFGSAEVRLFERRDLVASRPAGAISGAELRHAK